MNRRTFVKSALAAASLAELAASTNSTTRAAESDGGKSQYYEWRSYSFKSPEQRALTDSYWHDAAIPALNRLGVKPVGAFTELEGEKPGLHILIPFDSFETFAALPSRLAEDSAYQEAGKAYLNAPKSAPAYDRIESSLSVAFDGMKRLDVPEAPSEEKPRVFELRTYESHSEAKGLNKVLMFNSGEIPLMKEVNLGPVFFARNLIGSRLPSLTYMVSGPNKDEHAKNWKAFFAAPTWKKLIGDSQYKDNVSKVVSTFLKRTPYSQI